MAETSQLPFPSRPGRPVVGAADTGGGQAQGVGLLAFVAVVLGSALLGIIGGFVWEHVAPRAIYVVVGGGAADVVNPETSAFIAADGWFCAIAVAGGIVSGLLGYLLAVRRYGALPMAGVLGGGLAAAYIAMWIGQRTGSAAFDRRLAASKAGTLLRAPIMLNAHEALAFWPLAAGLVAGGIQAVAMLRGRHRALAQQSAYAGAHVHGPATAPGSQGPGGQTGPAGQAGSAGQAGRDAEPGE